MTLTLKRRILSVSALFLMMLTVVSGLIVPANAATRSSGTRTQTITVYTKANWFFPGSSSITLKQNKGIITYSKTNWKQQVIGTGTKSSYGTWKVVAKATDGSHTVRKTMTGSSVKLDLKANKTYQITVTYDFTSNDVLKLINYRNSKWSTYPSWSVGGTWKISSYF